MSRLDDITRPKIKHVNVPLELAMFTYSEMLDEFYKFIFNTDLKDMGIDFKKVIIGTQMPFRNRLMRTRAEQLGVARPVLSVNGSIYTDDVGNGLLPGEVFNTDMSHLYNVVNYSDTIIYNRDETLSQDTLFNVVSKEGMLNVEFNIIDDFLLKIESYKENWLRTKFRDWTYGVNIPIRYIVPIKTVLIMLVKLKIIPNVIDLSKYTYPDLCKMLFPYVVPTYRPKVMRDKSRGTWEFVIEYDYDMVYKCDIVNTTPPEQKGFVDKNFVLTRSFMLRFIMPSIYILDTSDIIPGNIIDEFIQKQKELIEDTNIVNTPVINIVGDSGLGPYTAFDAFVDPDSEYAKSKNKPVVEPFTIRMSKLNERVKLPNKLDKYTLLAHGYYTHTDRDDKVIDCRNLLSGSIIEFYKKIKEDNVGVHNFFKIVYYEESILKNPQYFTVDYENLTVYDNNVDVRKESLVAIYIDGKEFQDYMVGD